jgi:Leucine-rich repeat (LRR) protein
VTEEHLTRRGPERVKHLEMFMYNYPKLKGLTLFSNLTSLCIMQQRVESIQGLDNCAQLKHLWVVECRLTRLEGLEKCAKLERLYLYGNGIRAIENLDHLGDSLRTLWVSDNALTDLPDLSPLRELKELNVARNKIEKAADALVANTKLV